MALLSTTGVVVGAEAYKRVKRKIEVSFESVIL